MQFYRYSEYKKSREMLKVNELNFRTKPSAVIMNAKVWRAFKNVEEFSSTFFLHTKLNVGQK